MIEYLEHTPLILGAFALIDAFLRRTEKAQLESLIALITICLFMHPISLLIHPLAGNKYIFFLILLLITWFLYRTTTTLTDNFLKKSLGEK